MAMPAEASRPRHSDAMIHVELPDGFAAGGQKLPFFLAMEEYLARESDGECFFMWQVAPTVIFGRNQHIESEVNLGFCRCHGIQVYRRKSGGGCVYADRNNIMFSYVATSGSVACTFGGFTGKVAGMLRCLGLDASATGRNDILIGDRKVSGYAFYNINLTAKDTGRPVSRAIVHGTMLYDADLDTMSQALTPSAVKLDAKGVASVRQHVTTVREHCGIGLDAFKEFACTALCDSSIRLQDSDIRSIRGLEQAYYSHDWIYGTRRRQCTTPYRIEGAGEFVVDMRLSPSVPPHVASVDLSGDFFITGDIDNELLSPLVGCELSREAISNALEGKDAGMVIHNLTTGAFIDMVLNAPACRY